MDNNNIFLKKTICEHRQGWINQALSSIEALPRQATTDEHWGIKEKMFDFIEIDHYLFPVLHVEIGILQ